MNFEAEIEKIKSETKERIEKFIEELRSESKIFSAKLNDLTGHEAYEKLRDFYYILIRFKIKYIEIEYDFRLQLDKLKASIERSSLSNDEKRKIYDAIGDLSEKFSEIKNPIKNLDNLINELKPKIQAKEVNIKSLHIEETINDVTENMTKTLTTFRNANLTQ